MRGIQVSHGSIYTILKQNRLIMKPYKPRRQRTHKRWQRRLPDSLWQTDILPITAFARCPRLLQRNDHHGQWIKKGPDEAQDRVPVSQLELFDRKIPHKLIILKVAVGCRKSVSCYELSFRLVKFSGAR